MDYFPKISSRDNPKIKFARAVRDGKEKNLIFVEGVRLAEEILKTSLKIHFVFFTSKLLENPRTTSIFENLRSKNIDVFELESRLFDTLIDTKNSQGLILITEKPQTGKSLLENNLSEIPFLILIHQINNPANLGAILRTAEAVGVDGVITTKGTVDVFSPKTIRGAMGANFRLPMWVNSEFNEVIEWTQDRKIKSICADIRSNNSFLAVDWNVPRLLVMGSEGHGLSDSERNATDESLIIPLENQVESLNVAVACGVILFEAKRQKDSVSSKQN